MVYLSFNHLDNTVGMSNTAVGTSKYMSPERLLCQPYNETADVFALGLVILEALNNNEYIFDRSATTPGDHSDFNEGYILSPIDLLNEFENINVNQLVDESLAKYPLAGGVSKEFREFLCQILLYDTHARPTAL